MNYYNRNYRKIFGILVSALVFFGFVIFAKAAPTVTVTAPNGGEVLTTSKIYRITWNSENVDKVSIGYSFGEGSLNWIATNIANTNYYDWTVNLGNTTNTKAKIYVLGYQTGIGSVSDYSNDFFTVSQDQSVTTQITTVTSVEYTAGSNGISEKFVLIGTNFSDSSKLYYTNTSTGVSGNLTNIIYFSSEKITFAGDLYTGNMAGMYKIKVVDVNGKGSNEILVNTAPAISTQTASTPLVDNSPASAPSLEISANPSTISPGQSATISWSTSATFCNAPDLFQDSNWNKSGSQIVKNLESSKTFSMTCYATGGGGTVTKSVTVKVVDLSADVSITSNKSSLSDSQISSILSLLQSFGTEQSIINNVENSLRGKVTSTTSKPPFAGSPNLPADVDHESTYSCADLKNDLRYRARDASTSGEVSLLQDFLQAKGYLKSDPTGYFGLLTFQAVKDLQKLNEISPTGFVGSITRAKIKSLSCVVGL